MLDFKTKKLREIRWWAWAAAVLPLSSLAGLWFIWAFGTDHAVNIAMIVGFTAMFAIAVAWWWWALHVFKSLLDLWKDTGQGLEQVLDDVKEIKTLVREVIPKQDDK